MSQGIRLAQSTAKLKQLADQQRWVRKQADELEEAITSQQAKLASLHSALATLEKDYAEMAAACAPAAAKRGANVTESAPQESIQVLEGLSKVLDDGAYLNAAYTSYLAQCDANQAQPEPAALWISKAASAELAKTKGILLNSQVGEALPKKRHVARSGSDTQH